jgi:hypothetical protein
MRIITERSRILEVVERKILDEIWVEEKIQKDFTNMVKLKLEKGEDVFIPETGTGKVGVLYRGRRDE